MHDKLHDRAGVSRNGMVAKWKVSGLSKWVVSEDEEFCAESVEGLNS